MTTADRIIKVYKTKTNIKKTRGACKRLLNHYLGKKRAWLCPLCGVAGHNCEKFCPWYVINHKSCADHKFRGVATIDELRKLHDIYPEWKEMRVRQLKKWIEHFDRALEKLCKS